ncbi:MAG: NUDIX domain-containing protein [Oscillatoria sp. SIO1A7]|nr:NUDIX domain-containing protein [Oscillatoria sp. SIO1A7]
MKEPIAVSIAVLKRNGKFLLQLRDNIPNIIYPGYWAFFGGHIEENETPLIAMRRELQEEIGYVPPVLSELGCFESVGVLRHTFYGELTVDIEELVLGEGWDMGLWTVEDIKRGDRYSEKAGQVRPIGPPHQKILLDLISQGF